MMPMYARNTHTLAIPLRLGAIPAHIHNNLSLLVRSVEKVENVYKFVMWSEETHHMVQNWYFELLISCENLNDSLSITFYLDLLWYCYQKILMFKAYIINIRIMMLICFILQFPFATCDRFSQITSYIYYSQSHFICGWFLYI